MCWTPHYANKHKYMIPRYDFGFLISFGRIRISKKYRQHYGQKKKYKRTNNDLQNIHIKLKIE
jgi:hypothetical protein